MAELLKGIHSIRKNIGDWKNFLKKKFGKRIEMLKEIDKGLYEFFKSKFNEIVERYGNLESYSLIHGDICEDNIIEDGRRRYHLIDWEDSLFGDPYYDLAFVYFYWKENFNEFEKYYGNVDFKRILDYSLLISLKKYLNRLYLRKDI